MKIGLINTISKIALVLIPSISLSMTATAHDPSLHAKKAEKADCSKMDHSKMDMKDPVAIAMMNKCMKQAEKSNDKMDHSKMNMKMDHSQMNSKMDHSKMKTMDEKKQKKADDNNH
jgi:hypothetical protein